MKNEVYNKVILFAISLVLGLVIVTQGIAKNNILGQDNSVENKLSELNNQLAELNLEKNQLREELDSINKILEEKEKDYNEKSNVLDKLKQELDKQKILSGYYEVKGQGTIIRIDAEPNSYVSLASSHQYILALISYLNNAGAEAVSINGQRYTNYTEIVPVLNHINVNGVAMVLPLEIKAIGNQRAIEASLNFVGGIITQLKQIGYTVETKNSNDITINKYTEEKEFKYAKPIVLPEDN